MQKVVQSLQLLISHQVRPYSSVEAIRELSFTCFFYIWVITAIWENWAKIGPKICISWVV